MSNDTTPMRTLTHDWASCLRKQEPRKIQAVGEAPGHETT